jgi:hypothetical protein
MTQARRAAESEIKNKGKKTYLRYIVKRSRNHCCYKTQLFPFYCFGVYNIKVFSAAMEMQQWVPFALLTCYKTFRKAVKKNTH